jgi:hypothetical protein
MKNLHFAFLLGSLFLFGSCTFSNKQKNDKDFSLDQIKKSFTNPPDAVRPGVYWYFMDGNLSRQEMTADLESMKKAGIGNVIFLEVNVGVPRGKIDFLSPAWQELFAHAMRETKRLGITLTLGVGPGWTGSGGPWVKAEESMRHLVAGSVNVNGGKAEKIKLPVPEPYPPFFGESNLTPELKEKWKAYYQDVAVLAFPTPLKNVKIEDIDEKSLYVRAPYTSMPGVKSFLPEPFFEETEDESYAIDQNDIIDVTQYLKTDDTLQWNIPEGKWTIMRFGMRNNGAVTRPAPYPGIGFECDKFDTTAFKNHFDAFIGKLFSVSNFKRASKEGGLFRLHMDSWEMGAQNWSDNFREEFENRRGYDPLPFLPVYAGQIVGSEEMSERFLWDMRITAQELVLENHAEYIKKLGQQYGLDLSIEPYDMTPCADLDLGAVADVPSCEFWLKGYGFNSSFSSVEATSIAHIKGKPIVAAEAFTADSREGYAAYPGFLKNQGDWAFAAGINQFIYHTFVHKALDEHLRPGMTMGPYGVHWDRGQTWWPMVSDYHKYVSRCSFVLQQGQTVADILYLTPEGAPHVFRPPHSAMEGNDTIPDRKGFNFDGCSPQMLAEASVKNHKIVFPGGASYHLLVMPIQKTMTPGLLAKIEELIKTGANVVGIPPLKSPSLVNYPQCDIDVKKIAEKIWGATLPPKEITIKKCGKGKIYWGGDLSHSSDNELYPSYEATSSLLRQMGVDEDFKSSNGKIRYTHKKLKDADIYFIANRTDDTFQTKCSFRVGEGAIELWNPLTGEIRELSQYTREKNYTSLPLTFDAFQSYFIVFDKTKTPTKNNNAKNFSNLIPLKQMEGEWKVSFNTRWGGPEEVIFPSLSDWSQNKEEGIKYYSGIATYKKIFNFNSKVNGERIYLHLGEVKNIARVKLNGIDLGVIWTAPWQVEITDALTEGENHLEIDVANLWINRLIGDEHYPDDGIKNGKWPEWLVNKTPRPTKRFTFSTYKFYTKDSPLVKSGLLGPVQLLITEKE